MDGVARKLIWLYFILLLTEGAIRKWVLPGSSNLFLVIRDPVAAAIIVIAFQSNKSVIHHPLMVFFLIVAGISILIAPFAPTYNLKTAIYGIRTNFLHLPLIFLIPCFFGPKDVINVGKWLLLIAVPMAWLSVKQFNAEAEDIINTTAGGGGVQLETAGGKVRTTGTFSFVSGIIYFVSFVTAFVCFGLLHPKMFNRAVLAVAAIACIAAIATSGSRAMVASNLIVVGFCFLIYMIKPAVFGRLAKAIMILGVCLVVAFRLPVVQEGLGFLEKRFVEASRGGPALSTSTVQDFMDRNMRNFQMPFDISLDTPILGYGLGLGTNAGAVLAGRGQMALGEEEWGRVIKESGPIAGNLFLLWRVALVVFLFMVSLRLARQHSIFLPLLLFAASAPLILYGQIGQPTTLGFASLGGGMILAASKIPLRRPPLAAPAPRQTPEPS